MTNASAAEGAPDKPAGSAALAAAEAAIPDAAIAQAPPHSRQIELPTDERTKRSSGGFRISQAIAGDIVAISDLFAVGLTALFVGWFADFNGISKGLGGDQLVLLAPAIAFISVLALRAAGLHKIATVVQVSQQASQLLFVWAAVSITASAILLALGIGTPLVLLAWLCLTPAVLLTARAGLAVLFRTLMEQGRLARRVAVIGPADELAAAKHLVNSDRLVTLAGVFELPQSSDAEAVNSRTGEILNALSTDDFDDVLILVPSRSDESVTELATALTMLPVRIALLPVAGIQNLNEVRAGDANTYSVTLYEKPVRGWSILAKTVFDYLVALVMLMVFAVPMLAIAVAIRLEGPGDIIFRQRRTGLGGRLFYVRKFRSMSVMEDGPEVRQARKQDQRVTRVGRIIRRTSLDELPQIFNVLSGDMSIVGPRPHARAHDLYYAQFIPDYRLRFRVKPGITGWAQIHGWRGETRTIEDMASRVDYDVEYAAGYSLFRDILVVALTPFVGFFSAKSY